MHNFVQVFSDRCLKFGIHELRCDIQKTDNKNIGSFLSILKENGIVLTGGFERFDPNKPQVFKRLSSTS